LDAGIVIEGAYSRWGSSKGLLILTTIRTRFRAVIAEPVAEEIARNMRKRTAGLLEAETRAIISGLDEWLKIARPERLPWPTDKQMERHAGLISAVRHDNDMPAVVAAVVARPDWILSTNTAHWNQELAQRAGLRVAHPAAFLESLRA
jgi:hypothetical protein